VTGVIDLNAERGKPRKKGKDPEPPDDGAVLLYMCDCGCGLWRLYADGACECINCGAIPDGLRTVAG